tara:strand:- start:73 stop:258 length:186 start_codon:yes stop_codon:yes gene_type:complete
VVVVAHRVLVLQVVLLEALVEEMHQQGQALKEILVVAQATAMMVVAEETMPVLPVVVEQAQ